MCAECILDHAGHKLLKLDDPVLEFRFEVKNLIGKVSEMGGNLSLKKQEL